jgi:hypothetical protein
METRKKEAIIDAICGLFILLFVYTAASKLLDFHKFNVELHKSPLLVDFGPPIAWLVPSMEIVLSASLIFQSTRRIGLYGSLALMLLFTFYIVAILGFSEHVPCTCGGIIQKMTWTQHLFFNLSFCGLAVGALRLSTPNTGYLRNIFLIAAGGGISVASLFLLTYEGKEKYSSFDVIWLKSGLGDANVVDLGVNSYYFAGSNSTSLYLGNSTTPARLTEVSQSDGIKGRPFMAIDDSVTTRSTFAVASGHWFLYDGFRPRITMAGLGERRAVPTVLQYSYFDMLQPASKTILGFRTLDSRGEFTLACSSDSGLVLKPQLIKKQIDGRFCKDGIFLFNKDLNRFCYVYYYRNQFVVTDSFMNHPLFRKTIDSIRTAKLKIAQVNDGDRTASTVVPQLVVNKNAFAHSSFLFIHSGIRARNQSRSDFERHPRIDVYGFVSGNYLGSFSIPLSQGSETRQFMIVGDTLNLLVSRHLVKYNIRDIVSELEERSEQKTFTGR